MELRCLTADHEFDALEPEWNALADSSSGDMPFTRFGYLRAWWRTRGGGEWYETALRLVTARDQGRLIGVAPFFRASHENRAAWLLLGSYEITDYLDLIVLRGREQEFTGRLLPFVAAQPAEDFQRLDLYNLRAESASLAALERAAGEAGWRIAKHELQPCPAVALPGTWDAFLEGLDKKQRHEVRRKLRRGQADEQETAWAIVGPQADIQAEIEKFLALMKLDDRKAAFLTDPMVDQFRLALAEAHSAGWLQLAFLTIDGRPAAAYVNFDYANRIWVYNSAIDPYFAARSPGWVLLARLIEWAIDHGREVLDFMRGNEGYKFQWGGVSRPIYRLTLEPPAA